MTVIVWTQSDAGVDVLASFMVDRGGVSRVKADDSEVEQVISDYADLKRWDGAPPENDDAFAGEIRRTPERSELRSEVVSELRRRGYFAAERRDVPDGVIGGVSDLEATLRAETRYSEGDKVELDDGSRGVVVEVRMATFDGPDGSEVDASEDSPAYIVATEDGAEAVTASELVGSDWSTDRDDPDTELADGVAGQSAEGRLEAGPTDWDFPESWKESDIPARLILLDAWSSMGGQFDCGGGCCKGTMMKSGMGDRASDQFCASMKDRVLLWEGWR